MAHEKKKGGGPIQQTAANRGLTRRVLKKMNAQKCSSPGTTKGENCQKGGTPGVVKYSRWYKTNERIYNDAMKKKDLIHRTHGGGAANTLFITHG